MGYFDNIDWKTIKKDLQKGIEKGAVALKQGALVVQKRAGELSEEGKRQYKIMALKSKMHGAIADLGARVYALMRTGSKNPALDARLKDQVVQLKKMDAQIAALEKPKPVARKKRQTAQRKRKAQ
jgi:hypothetical protein